MNDKYKTEIDSILLLIENAKIDYRLKIIIPNKPKYILEHFTNLGYKIKEYYNQTIEISWNHAKSKYIIAR